MDLFSLAQDTPSMAPLAERMRAETLEDFVGQRHIIEKNSLLRRAISADRLGSCIFWGPPGTGKTTLANIIAKSTQGEFVKLNAVTCGVADVKRVVEQAKEIQRLYGKRTYLLLDECHRFSKTQSDSLLPAIEQGDVIFIGSTTENPYIAMTPAIVSRCRVFEFKKLEDAEIKEVLVKAISHPKGLKNLPLDVAEDALNHFVWAAGGDLRTALNALELAAVSTPMNAEGKVVIDLLCAEQSVQKKVLSVDENLYYDILSAFCKSLRGSDPDAALYWAQRLISAGCDPRLIARRLVVHSCEDVGMADPNALVVATSALTALEKLGLPEGNIPLSTAILYVATAPKSNSTVVAMGKAQDDAEKTRDDNVPLHLRDTHYSGAEKRNGKCEYLYPHDFGGYVSQQYLPDSLADRRYYYPSENGKEKDLEIQKYGKENGKK